MEQEEAMSSSVDARVICSSGHGRYLHMHVEQYKSKLMSTVYIYMIYASLFLLTAQLTDSD